MIEKMMVTGQRKMGGTVQHLLTLAVCASRDGITWSQTTWSPNQMYCNWARGFGCLSSTLLVSVEVGFLPAPAVALMWVDVKVT
jgi:hypothetical protein